jgi:hypothetical protein
MMPFDEGGNVALVKMMHPTTIEVVAQILTASFEVHHGDALEVTRLDKPISLSSNLFDYIVSGQKRRTTSAFRLERGMPIPKPVKLTISGRATGAFASRAFQKMGFIRVDVAPPHFIEWPGEAKRHSFKFATHSVP